MDNIEYLGLIGGVCTTISFLPQVIKIITTKSTKNISLLTYIIFSIGLIVWITYGYLSHSYALIISNSITLLLSVAIIVMKLKWR